MKRQTVTPAAIKAMARRNTKASARLEGREVPPNFVRSPAVEQYIAERSSGTSDASVPRCEPDPTEAQTGIPIPAQAIRQTIRSFLKTEIWPLLEDRSPITKTEREQILDDPTSD
jgi:antitoxin VapB